MIAEKRAGHPADRWHAFLAVSEKPITRVEAAEAQSRLGFIPAGYGLFDFETQAVATANGVRHIAEWRCSASCD